MSFGFFVDPEASKGLFFLSCSFEARRIGDGNRAINSYLELGEGETTTGTDPSVVLKGRASHDRSELVDGTGSQSSGLGLTSSTSPGLAAGLFENKSISRVQIVPTFPMSQLFFSIIWVSRIAYLVEVSANPSLPILAEICGNISVAVHHCSYIAVSSSSFFDPSRGRCSRLLIRVWLCLIACLKIKSQ